MHIVSLIHRNKEADEKQRHAVRVAADAKAKRRDLQSKALLLNRVARESVSYSRSRAAAAAIAGTDSTCSYSSTSHSPVDEAVIEAAVRDAVGAERRRILGEWKSGGGYASSYNHNDDGSKTLWGSTLGR